MTNPLRPHEALVAAFYMDGESDEDAQRLARTALGSLVAAGFVLKTRDGMDFIPLPVREVENINAEKIDQTERLE